MTVISNKSDGSVLSRFRNHLLRSSEDELIGQPLASKRMIPQDELNEAVEFQRDKHFKSGKAVSLQQVILEQGCTTEKNVSGAVSDYGSFTTQTFSKDFFRRLRGAFNEEYPSTRIPIWLQLSIATLLILTVSIAIFGYVIMERQKEKLFDQTIKLGMVSLNYFSNNAKIPLLNDDILELNTLINNAASVDGHFYAFIVDNKQVIKAHTDHSKIDKTFEPFTNVDKTYTKGNVSYFDYTTPGREHVLNLSMPISFNDKKLGEVHVGLSFDFVRELFVNERAILAGIILVILSFGMIVAVIFSMRFSRPISKLVTATTQIARGNYGYKVNLRRKDELGTLGSAFNKMGDELYRQSLMKESFGKYVGPEVLDMIMKSPERGWLKGRRNEVSVLFADIRGFTAYSEAREPEEVVEKLNEFFEIAAEIVMEHGGYIDKFMGDSVLAVFGVPVFYKDHSEKCLKAALAMQQEFAKPSRSGNALLKSVGIGVASGVVVAGNIGSQLKTEYTVIGDCVNVASYLNNIARAGDIIIGNGMGRDYGHLIEVEALEPQRVKGKEERVEIYRVVPTRSEEQE